MLACPQFGPKRKKSRPFVGRLTATTSTQRDDPGTDMGQAYATLRDVLMLTALAARTKHIDSALSE